MPSRTRSTSLPLGPVVAGVAVLLVGLAAGFLIRGWVDPAATPGVTTTVTATTGSDQAAGASPQASCTPGESGPMRQDLSFTADDGSGTTVPFSISLPADYYTSCATYPVLYALHGKGDDNVEFMDKALPLRRVMDAGVLDQAIIVAPDSFDTGRWEDRDTGPAETNFIERLMPFVEENYRVTQGPSHRLLVGFSMGGHGALRFGLKYPDAFAAVWSVDGAMADPQTYVDLVGDRTSADFHIVAVGGQLNGDRVQATVDALKQRGIDIPYTYQDREHEFGAFVDQDEKANWFAMKFLQSNLGRPM